MQEAEDSLEKQRLTMQLTIDNLETDKMDLIRHLEEMQRLHVADKERLHAELTQNTVSDGPLREFDSVLRGRLATWR